MLAGTSTVTLPERDELDQLLREIGQGLPKMGEFYSIVLACAGERMAVEMLTITITGAANKMRYKLRPAKFRDLVSRLNRLAEVLIDDKQALAEAKKLIGRWKRENFE